MRLNNVVLYSGGFSGAITIYLQSSRLPVQVQPKWPARCFLRLIFVAQLVLAFAVIYFTVLHR